MGFSTVEAITPTGLGGINKKTGKANPKTIEGYFLRTIAVSDTKKKAGVGYVHYFQTADGEVAIWGKTDLDRKLKGVRPGVMVRCTATGKTKPTPNGDMILYLVEQDISNNIPVSNDLDAPGVDGDNEEYSTEEPTLDEEETPADEVQVSRPKAPLSPSTVDPARAAKVKALLAGKSAQ